MFCIDAEYVLVFFLDAKLARWNENVMVRFPNG